MRPILAALVLALAVTSCGGGDEPETPDESPAKLLTEAFASPARSGEAVADLKLALEGLPVLRDPITANVGGPFELAADGGLPSFDLALDGSVAGFGVDGELVSTGEDAFVVFFGENYRVGAERVAAAEGRLAAGGGAGGLGLDPASWFESPRYAGSEDVEGTDAEKIEAGLDPAAMAEDVSAAANALGAPALIGALASGAGPGEIEAWVAYDDHTVRRLRMAFPFQVPPGQRRLAAGATGGTVQLGVELTDIGAEVEIAPPEGGGFQPIDQLIGRLRDLASLGL